MTDDLDELREVPSGGNAPSQTPRPLTGTLDPGNPLTGFTRRVIIKTPFMEPTDAGQQVAPDAVRNHRLSYLNACVADCILRGEAPLAAPAIVTGAVTRAGAALVADDLAVAWAEGADAFVIYEDLGEGAVEQQPLEDALPVERRKLGEKWGERVAALPFFLGIGDVALVWTADEAAGDVQVSGYSFGSATDKQPVLWRSLAWALNNMKADQRLARELERFVERINRIATELNLRAAAQEKAKRQ